MSLMELTNICNACVCQSVCGVYHATGGMNKCDHYHEKDCYIHRVRAEAHQVTMTMKCGRCGAYVLEQDHLCPGCGAMFDGSVK